MISQLISGDTYNLTYSNGTYPSSEGWALSLYINGAKPIAIDGVASSDDNGWTVTIDSTRSAFLTKGTYRYTYRVSKDGESFTVESGTLQVLPNPALGKETIPHAQKMLDLVEAAMLGNPEALTSMSLSGRSFSFMTMNELREERDYWRRELLVITRGPSRSSIGSIRLNVRR